jgi:phosphonate transport system ATP-binding protein
MTLIKVLQISKTFKPETVALKNVSFNIEPGEMVALVGPSGSGKSTLIRIIACLENIDNAGSGLINLFGKCVQADGKILSSIKTVRKRLGVVFQSFNLVGRLSLETNVLTGLLGHMPRWRGILGYFLKSERIRAFTALQRVGILAQSRQRASTLSGGQQQRAAIARTLVQNADIILADEPVASLDPAAADKVMQTLAQINLEDKATVLVSLHQIEYALKYCTRIIALKDGGLIFDGKTTDTTPDFFTKLYGRKIDHDEALS